MIHQLNVIGKDHQTDGKHQTPLIIITALETNLMVTLAQTCNYPFPPVNWTILLHYWKPQGK